MKNNGVLTLTVFLWTKRLTDRAPLLLNAELFLSRSPQGKVIKHLLRVWSTFVIRNSSRERTVCTAMVTAAIRLLASRNFSCSAFHPR